MRTWVDPWRSGPSAAADHDRPSVDHHAAAWSPEPPTATTPPGPSVTATACDPSDAGKAAIRLHRRGSVESQALAVTARSS